MAKGKRQKKEKYQAQKIRTTVNKKKAWKKHLEKNPNDIQGKQTLGNKLRDI